MDPIRLQLLLSVTFGAAQIPLALVGDLYTQAIRQLYARWPLVGCVVRDSSGTAYIIAVGRQ